MFSRKLTSSLKQKCFLQCVNLPPNNQVPAGAQLQSAPVPFVRRRWRNTGYRVHRRIYTLRDFNGILKNRRSSEFDRLEKQLSRKVLRLGEFLLRIPGRSRLPVSPVGSCLLCTKERSVSHSALLTVALRFSGDSLAF